MSYYQNEKRRVGLEFEKLRQRDGKWVILGILTGFLLGVLVGMLRR